MSITAEETPRQEIRRLRWIVNHVARLSPEGRRWLISWLRDKFPNEAR